jgi:RimJ/RimL family protein N-acetyltransferase
MHAVVTGDAVGHWTADRLGTAYWEAHSRAIGLERDGEIVAGCIFENWNGRSIMVHMAVRGRLTRAFIKAIFDYAYRVCGVSKVICPVDETNVRSQKLLQHMGFAEEARLRDCSLQGDIVLFTLRKADCRFLGDWSSGEISAKSAPGS